MPASLLHAFGIIALAWSWLAFDHYRPWVNFSSESLAFFGLALLAVSLLLKSSQPGTRLTAVVVGMALIPWVQWSLGINHYVGDALMASIYLFALALAIGVGFAFVRPDERASVPSFIHVLWVVAMASGAIGLAQWLNVQEGLQMYVAQTDVGDRAMGNMGQPNQLATLLLMGIASYALLFEKRQIGRLAFAVGIVFLSLLLLLTESRSGLLGALVLASFVAWKSWRCESRMSPGVVIAWAGACFAGRFVVPAVQSFLHLGSGRGLSLTDSNSRWLIWQQVWEGVLQAPWFGYGWNHTSTAHGQGAIAHPGSLSFSNAHNVVLDLMAWNGIPLGLLIVLMCGYWLSTRMRRAERPAAVFAMAALLPLAVHSLLEYPFAYGYFLVAGGLLVGVVEASIDSPRTVVFAKRWIWGALLVWMAAGVVVVYEYFLIQEDFRIVRFENLRIGRTPAEYRPPTIHMLTHMGAMLDASRMRPTPGMRKQDLDTLRETSRRFPYSALALRNAVALGLNGDPEGATKQLAVLRGMYGEYYYAAAKHDLRELQAEKYPQLGAVLTP